MTVGEDASQRVTRIRRRSARKTFGSLQYLFALLLLLPPTLAFTTGGAKLLGRAQMPVGLLLYIPPVILAFFIVREQKRRTRELLKQEEVCHKCFYDLTGNVSGICPECGTEIKPP